jgi:hypothetical protein
MNTTSAPPVAVSGLPNFWDIMFLLLLTSITLLIVGLGVLAYEEGHKTELVKHHGESWGEFLASQSDKRTQPDYEIEACAAQDGNTWGGCYQALVSPGAPLDGLENPFTKTPQKLATACDSKDRALRGALVMDKLEATPPGSAVPIVSSSLGEDEPITKKLQIKISVCDKFSSPILVGEFQF